MIRPARRRAPASLHPGMEVAAKDATVYVVQNAVGTLKRRDPKAKGKAARKAEKRARRLSREA